MSPPSSSPSSPTSFSLLSPSSLSAVAATWAGSALQIAPATHHIKFFSFSKCSHLFALLHHLNQPFHHPELQQSLLLVNRPRWPRDRDVRARSKCFLDRAVSSTSMILSIEYKAMCMTGMNIWLQLCHRQTTYFESSSKQGSRTARLSPQSMTWYKCMCSSVLVVT